MPNSNRVIKQFIRDSIENEKGNRKRLLLLFDKQLLFELTTYLQNREDKKFEETLYELLEDNDFRNKILLLIERQKAS
jgi:hypothetical protein